MIYINDWLQNDLLQSSIIPLNKTNFVFKWKFLYATECVNLLRF